MTIKLDIDAVPEEGTVVIQAAFTDEDDEPITPKSARWSLTDAGGAVINSRSRVDFASLDTTVSAVLSGADTALQGENDSGLRLFTVEAVYDSDIALDLPLNEEASFNIKRLVAIGTH